MRTSLLFFQSVGNTLVVSDVLNMMDRGVLILFTNSCRTRGWRPSGPGDLNVFSFFNFDATVDGLIICIGDIV